MWRNFMGRGLVEAEDDLRLTNPPSNEELLAALTDAFVRHGFDTHPRARELDVHAWAQRFHGQEPSASARTVPPMTRGRRTR